MNDIIIWCDDNYGFIAAILSSVGLLVSVIAIVVSIKTAHLPYKKSIAITATTDIRFGKCLETGDVISEVIGTSVNIINKGFRDVNITYLGFLVVCNHEKNKLYKINSSMDGLGILHPAEVHTNTFPKADLINNFSILEKDAKVYAFA